MTLRTPPEHHHARTSPETCEIVITLVDHLDAMLAYWDVDQRCRFANDAYHEWFGKSREDLIGTTLASLLGPQLYELNRPFIDAAYRGERQVFERAIMLPDGTVRHSLATYAPHIVDGAVRGIFVHVADVGPLKQLEAELIEAKAKAEELATHDFLTGLPNRVLLADRITQALSLARRNGDMACLIAVDLDDFKLVNDTYGHVAGDDVLITVAGRLRALLRESDTVTRTGGDEFLIVLGTAHSVEQAESAARRILEHVGQPSDQEGRITPAVSLGIALYPQHGETVDELLEAADRALYRAKRLGKNRYAIADG